MNIKKGAPSFLLLSTCLWNDKSEKKFWSDREREKRYMGSSLACLKVSDLLNGLDVDRGVKTQMDYTEEY